MKVPKFLNKTLVAVGAKEPPRRRGLGKKNPKRLELESNGERSLIIAPRKVVQKVQPNGALLTSVRNYKEVVAVGGVNSDWAINAISEDSDIWQNIFLLRQRSRDLFKIDVYFQKYIEEMWANVFGSTGYSMRLLIKETEDRVVYSNGERSYLEAHQRRFNRVLEWAARRTKNEFKQRVFIRNLDRQTAEVQIGDLDLYAIKLIEDAWKEWQRREYCTMAGRLNYNEVRQVRLLSAARDGDFFIRHIRDPRANKFGYSQQLINGEWCDNYLNTYLPNGNEIRMGIERDAYGKPINYYFIRRQPYDWQYSVPGAFNYSSAEMHEVIPASDIIHYARYRDGDSTRPAPWSASVIPKSRHLDKYEEAEVVAARVNAMKMGFFYSDMVPEGGEFVGENPDPTKANTLEAEPGSFQGLPWGIKFDKWDPTHPNQNFDLFRKGMLRAWCAGLPGANYNIIANDLEGVNYSSGRLGMLDERELWKLIQMFDIDVAERPTFEAWLEMALMTQAIKLPSSRFDKYNKPVIRGRRWAWVDPLKEVQASALQVANKFISRTRVIEDSDVDADFEQILFELAEEQMMMEELGMDSTPVVGKVSPSKPAQDTADDEEDGSSNSSNETDGTSKALSLDEFERQLAIARAGTTNINLPAITMPAITITPPNISVTVPEQKAAIVNVAGPIVRPNIKMPEIRPPDVIVNVAQAAAPEVNITNDIKIPATKKVTIARDDSGKLSGIQVEKE